MRAWRGGWSRTQEGDGGYRLDEGAVLAECCHCLHAMGGMSLLEEVHGTAIHREMVPSGQDVLLDGLKPLCGLERMHALPPWVCSDAALMQLVGFDAPRVRQGVCRRGAVTRQGARTPGPICPDPLAKHMVQWTRRDLEAGCNGRIRALAQAGVFAATGTGMAEGPDVETTERSTGCGQVTRPVGIEDTQGRRPAIEGIVYGWNGLLLLDAASKISLAVKMGTMHAHEALWTRALVTPARLQLAGAARRQAGICDQGVLEGSTLGWLDQHGITCVVPATPHMAVTADGRAQAAAGAAITVGRRAHPVRPGRGKTAWTARLETEGGGSTGLTTDDPYGTPEPGLQAKRRDFQAHPLHAVVVRQWHGNDYGPGGSTVVLTTTPGETPLPAFDDDDARRLLEHCCINAAKQQWDVGPPPQNTARAVRGPGLFTLRMVALATAYRRPGEREARAGEPVGWQRWRRQLREPPRAKGSGLAHGD